MFSISCKNLKCLKEPQEAHLECLCLRSTKCILHCSFNFCRNPTPFLAFGNSPVCSRVWHFALMTFIFFKDGPTCLPLSDNFIRLIVTRCVLNKLSQQKKIMSLSPFRSDFHTVSYQLAWQDIMLILGGIISGIWAKFWQKKYLQPKFRWYGTPSFVKHGSPPHPPYELPVERLYSFFNFIDVWIRQDPKSKGADNRHWRIHDSNSNFADL